MDDVVSLDFVEIVLNVEVLKVEDDVCVVECADVLAFFVVDDVPITDVLSARTLTTNDKSASLFMF